MKSNRLHGDAVSSPAPGPKHACDQIMRFSVLVTAVFTWFLACKSNAIPVEYLTDTSDGFTVRFNVERDAEGKLVVPHIGELSPSENWVLIFSPSGHPIAGDMFYETWFSANPVGLPDDRMQITTDIGWGTSGERSPRGPRSDSPPPFEALLSWNIAADGTGWFQIEGSRVPEGGATLGMLTLAVSAMVFFRRRIR